MSSHTAKIVWNKGNSIFTDGRYMRTFDMEFDGGASITGAASPLIVPLPFTDPSLVDPEEMLVASAASCHMLWFLSIAAKAGYLILSYSDSATGDLGKDAAGDIFFTRIYLRPAVVFSGTDLPDAGEIQRLHDQAHASCFIARSLKAEIVIEPVINP